MLCGYSIHHLVYFQRIWEDESHKYREVGMYRSFFPWTVILWEGIICPIFWPISPRQKGRLLLTVFLSASFQPWHLPGWITRPCFLWRGQQFGCAVCQPHPANCTWSTQTLSINLAMGWLGLPWGITSPGMPHGVRAMHEPKTLEKPRATMERKESSYAYVVILIHIDAAGMGTVRPSIDIYT